MPGGIQRVENDADLLVDALHQSRVRPAMQLPVLHAPGVPDVALEEPLLHQLADHLWLVICKAKKKTEATWRCKEEEA